MMEGGKPRGCGNCWHNESIGIDSLRNENMAMEWWKPYLGKIDRNTRTDGSYHHDPDYIDLRLGNKCNLGCRMCSAEFSSVLAKEVEEHGDRFSYDQRHQDALDRVNRYHADGNLDRVFEAVKKIDDVTRIQFTGGEPFLNKRIPELVDHFIVTGKAKHINIHFTTNLTKVPTGLLEKLEQFRYADVSVSMEGIGDIYEYIRYPAKWGKVSNNLKRLEQSEVAMGIAYTGTALSIIGFADWLEWVKSNDFQWDYNPVLYPEYLRINNIPDQLKKELIQRLEPMRLEAKERQMVDGMIAMLNKPQKPDDWQMLIKDTITKDGIRSQSIHRSVPKLAAYF